MLGGGKMKVLDDVSVSDNDIVDFVQRMCTPKMAVLAVYILFFIIPITYACVCNLKVQV